MALSKEFSLEQLNYFRVCYVTTNIIPEKLRIVFKHEWDARYGASHGAWNDTAKNGKDFFSLTTLIEQKQKKKELDVIKNGNAMEWDCTCLFYSILYSDCIGKKSMDPTVKKSVDVLRKFRNGYFAHPKDGNITEADFQTSIQDVVTAFTDLKLDVTEIEQIKNQKNFPTQCLRDMENQLEAERKKNKEPHLRPFCVLPLNPSHDTINRVKETSNIYDEMKKLRKNSKEKVTVTYISGNPGCGKSEVARQVGEKYFGDVSTGFVMTLDASSLGSLLTSYVELASFLQCNDTSIAKIVASQKSDEHKIVLLQKEFINSAVARYPSWLLIVDNAKDLRLVSKYVPHAGQMGNGHILITTQDSKPIAQDTSFSNHFSLSKGMQPDDAVNALSKISKFVDNEHIALQVAKEVDFQPLALACAAMWMQDTRITNKATNWATFLEKLREGSRQITESVYENKDTNYSKTMTTAIKMALEMKIAESEVMKYAFQFLSVTASEVLPLQYVVSYVMMYLPDEDNDSVASEIRSSSLILSSEENSKPTVHVHHIVHHTLQVLHPNETRDLAFWLNVFKVFASHSKQKRGDNVVTATTSLLLHFASIVNHVLAFFGNNQIYSWRERITYFITHFHTTGLTEQYQEMRDYILDIFLVCCTTGTITPYKDGLPIPLFKTILSSLSLHDAIVIPLNVIVIHLSLVLRDLGEYPFAENLLKNVLTKVSCPDDPFMAVMLSYFAAIIKDIGQYQDAKILSETALQSFCSDDEFFKILSPVYKPKLLNNHGVVLIDLGEFRQAKICFQKALASEENSSTLSFYGLDDQVMMSNSCSINSPVTFRNLGLVLQELGEYKQALIVLEKAADRINESRDREGNPSLAATLRIRALILQDLGQYVQARTLLERAIAIQESAYGNHSDNPWLTRMLRNLASVFQDLGQYLKARNLLEKAMAIEESTLCEDHPTLASTISSLASVLQDLGKYEQAKIYLERALNIQESTFNTDHPNIATTLCIFASVLQDLAKYKQAKTYLERALKIQVKTFDNNHPKVAITLTILASVVRDLGQYKHAKNLLERSIAILENVFDQDHPRLAATLSTLASVLQDLGQYEEAKVYLERALLIQESTLDTDHPRLASIMVSLALNSLGSRRYIQASSLLESALAIQKNIYDKDHPLIANTLSILASVLQDLGQYEQAKIHLERALTIEEKAFDNDHPRLAFTLSNLALVSQNLGDLGQAKILLDRTLSIKESTCNQDHPSWASTLRNLALVLQGFGKESKSLLERALVIQKGTSE